MVKCPTCGKAFDTKNSLKTHHKLSHGESLCLEESVCDIVGCNNSFTYYPNSKPGLICPECVENGENIWSTEKHKNLPNKLTTEFETNCYQCGCSMSVTKTENSEKNFCSNSCINKFNSDRMSGEDNPRYVDGESRGKKYDSKWRKIRDKALRKDKHCTNCGRDNNLHVHHIIPVRKFENEEDAHYIENALTLCAECHRNIENGNIDMPEIQRKTEKHKIENFKYLHN